MSIRVFRSSFRLTFATVAAAAVIALLPIASVADTIHVAEDAFTKADKPDENKGSDKKVEVVDKIGKERVGFAKFDILSILPVGVGPGDIVKATLRMYMEKVDKKKFGTIEVQRVDDEDWDEHSITANFPLLSHTVVVGSVDVTAADKDHFVTIDITNLFKDWVDGSFPNYGIALVATGGAKVKIGAKEADQDHEMQIEVVLGGGGAGAEGATAASSRAVASSRRLV